MLAKNSRYGRLTRYFLVPNVKEGENTMKKGPDIMVILVAVFVLGTVITGVTNSDIELVSVVSQVFSG